MWMMNDCMHLDLFLHFPSLRDNMYDSDIVSKNVIFYFLRYNTTSWYIISWFIVKYNPNFSNYQQIVSFMNIIESSIGAKIHVIYIVHVFYPLQSIYIKYAWISLSTDCEYWDIHQVRISTFDNKHVFSHIFPF